MGNKQKNWIPLLGVCMPFVRQVWQRRLGYQVAAFSLLACTLHDSISESHLETSASIQFGSPHVWHFFLNEVHWSSVVICIGAISRCNISRCNLRYWINTVLNSLGPSYPRRSPFSLYNTSDQLRYLSGQSLSLNTRGLWERAFYIHRATCLELAFPSQSNGVY